jgi:DNA polymerase I-like protein with 3'-5' exonuclease and polymerase domains
MVMAHLINENTEMSLEYLANRYCNIVMDKRIDREAKVVYFKSDDGKRTPLRDFETMPYGHEYYQQLMEYNRRDVEATNALYLKLREVLKERLWENSWASEHVDFTEVLLNMECAGMGISLDCGKDKLYGTFKGIENMYQMWERVSPIPPTTEILQHGLLWAERQASATGRVSYEGWSVPENLLADTSRSLTRWTTPSASVVSREEVREIPETGGSGTPRQRESDGQQTRELVRSPEGSPRQNTGGLSELACCARHLQARFEVDAASQEQKLYESLGYEINLNSWQQLGAVLFSKVWTQPDKLRFDKEQIKALRTAASSTPDSKDDNQPEDANDNPSNNSVHLIPPSFVVEKIGRELVHGYWTRKGFGLKKTPPSAKTKAPSTSTPDLLFYHGTNEWVTDLVAWRKLNKVITTYLRTYPQYSHEGRLYGRFDQTGTVTGRLSSRSPNMENQPAHGAIGEAVRSLFCGNLVVGDHSQLEPRLMAHFSGDAVLLDIYRTRKDIYITTAEYIFGRKVEKHEPERQLCKTLILALGYGAGAKKLAQILALNGFPTTIDDAQGYLEHLASIYSTFFQWKDAVIHMARGQGYVRTIGGRYRRLRYAFGDASWKIRSKGERQAVNSIIQGSAGDIMRRNMLDCRSYADTLTLINQVHDELVFEAPEGVWNTDTELLRRLRKTCENPGYELAVPLSFEPSWCSTWAEKGVNVIELPENYEDES